MVIVLIIVVILAIVIAQFSYSMSVDERIAKNFAADRKNYYAARGAIVLAKSFLEKDLEEYGPKDTLNDDWAENGIISSYQEIGEVTTDITVTDQERLININRLANKKNSDYNRIYESFLRLVEILDIDPHGEYAIVDRIVDYIDPDEEGEYELNASNAPFTTIEEMLQVEEIEPWMLYGRTDEFGERIKGLADYVGLWGSGRVNINTASSEVLQAISPEITDEDASNILSYRVDVETFNTPADLTNVTGLADIYQRDKTLMQYLTTASSYFEVRVKATRDTVKKDVRAVLRRQGRQTTVIFWKERKL